MQRQIGNDVAFICGSDEHNVVPITIKAKKKLLQDVVTNITLLSKLLLKIWYLFRQYSRTSSTNSSSNSFRFFKNLYDKNEFVEEVTEQYDAEAKQFLADRFVIGTCPKCGNEESYGDQCEACGTGHNATDLINPKSAIANAPILKETKHWFLPIR